MYLYSVHYTRIEYTSNQFNSIQFFISIHTEQYNFYCFSNYLCHYLMFSIFLYSFYVRSIQPSAAVRSFARKRSTGARRAPCEGEKAKNLWLTVKILTPRIVSFYVCMCTHTCVCVCVCECVCAREPPLIPLPGVLSAAFHVPMASGANQKPRFLRRFRSGVARSSSIVKFELGPT